jgi:hypothetical protein
MPCVLRPHQRRTCDGTMPTNRIRETTRRAARDPGEHDMSAYSEVGISVVTPSSPRRPYLPGPQTACHPDPSPRSQRRKSTTPEPCSRVPLSVDRGATLRDFAGGVTTACRGFRVDSGRGGCRSPMLRFRSSGPRVPIPNANHRTMVSGGAEPFAARATRLSWPPSVPTLVRQSQRRGRAGATRD